MSLGQPSSAEDRVELIESIGEWFVRVTESGNAHLTTFEREEFALSFSERQALRLGVAVSRG